MKANTWAYKLYFYLLKFSMATFHSKTNPKTSTIMRQIQQVSWWLIFEHGLDATNSVHLLATRALNLILFRSLSCVSICREEAPHYRGRYDSLSYLYGVQSSHMFCTGRQGSDATLIKDAVLQCVAFFLDLIKQAIENIEHFYLRSGF